MRARRCSTICWRAAHGGRFVLRIEDTDAERTQERFVDGLCTDLAWLGLAWDEGPIAPVRTRPTGSRSAPLYQQYFEQLERVGLAYPCFCTPLELELARRSAARGRPAAALRRHLPRAAARRRRAAPRRRPHARACAFECRGPHARVRRSRARPAAASFPTTSATSSSGARTAPRPSSSATPSTMRSCT